MTYLTTKFFKFILLLICFTISSPFAWADDSGGVLAGSVNTNTIIPLPLSGVVVQVSNEDTVLATVTTNIFGQYITPTIKQGNCTVTATLPTYQTVTVQNVKIQNKQTTTQNFQLVKQGAISGTVTNASTLTAIQGATVQAMQGSSVVATTTTASNGSYTLSNLNPGSYTVNFTATNFQSSTQSTTVVTNQSSTINRALTPLPGIFSGTVTNSITSLPISGVTITILQGSTVVSTTSTASNGTYSVTNLTPGSYTVRASANNFQTSNQTASIQTNQTTTVNAALIPLKGTLIGTLTNATTGAALSGATISVSQSSTVIATATTAANGTYTIPELNPGSYTVTASLTNFQTGTQASTIISSQTTTANFAMTPQTGIVAGVVISSQTSALLTGATVSVMQGNATIGNATTALGIFSIPNLAPGNYTLNVSATGYVTSILPITVQANLTLSINVSLIPQTGTLAGLVRNASTSLPLAGVTVSALQGSTVIATTTTAVDGTYTISNLTIGNYTVSASLTNFQSATQTFNISSGITSTANFSLTPLPGTISGTVTNSQTTTPLSGATVTILQGAATVSTTTTAANGTYNVSNLTPGSYIVRISATNFQTVNSTVAVSSNQTTTNNAALVAQTGILSGTVTNASTGIVLSGVTISALQGSTVVASTSTSVAGTYTISNLAPGSYTITANLTNYQTATQTNSISSNQTTTANFGLTAQPGTIAGTVTNSQTTSAISGATITILQGASTISTTTTAANGTYSVSNLTSGSYTVRISATNFQTSTQTAVVVSNLTTTINAALVPQTGTLSGTVSNAATSSALSGAAINVLQGSTVVATTLTAVNGTYTVSNLAPGNYTVTASILNFQTATQTATVSSNQTTTANFALTAQPGTIAGLVTNFQTAAPISGVTITILQGSTTISTTTTALNGTYSVSNLAPGSYTVSANLNNFQTGTQSAVVVSNQTSTTNFLLNPQPGSIGGTINDALTASTLNGVTVNVLQGATIIASTSTGANGTYSVSGLSPGNYTVSASLLNYQTNTKTATVSSNQNTTSNISLTPQPGIISGIISDASTTLPLSNATVNVLQGSIVISTTTTALNGSYSFTNLTPGSYTVRASATNYQTTTQSANVQSNQTATISLALQNQPGTISGTITIFSTITPISGSTVSVSQNGNLIASTTTAANGTFSIPNLTPGTYTVNASASNFQTSTQLAIVLANQTTIANLSLQPQPGSVAGNVTNAVTGSSVAGAIVEILLGNTVIASTSTDSNGQFTLTGLATGTYSLHVLTNSFQTGIQPVSVISNQTTTANISLQPLPGNISGTVIDALTLLPITNATVSVLTGSTLVVSTNTDNLGNFTISGLTPNSYVVRVAAVNYQTSIQGAIVSSNQITLQNFSLQPLPGSIAGTLIDASSSNPLSGATVSVLQANILIASTTTAGDGSYTIPGLAPGIYTVRASTTNYQTKLQNSTVQSNLTTNNNFSLLPLPGSINGIVKDVSSNILSGAIVEAFANNTVIASTITAVDGSYSFTGLAPGSYTITAIAVNYQSATLGASVQSNQTTTINFALASQPGSIIGQILDVSSNPIAGGIVSILLDNVLITSTVTDNNGNFNITNLAPNNYLIRISASNFQIATQGAIVQANLSTIINFSIQPQPGSINGVVVDASTSNPLKNANVNALLNNFVIASVTTDENGNYTLQNLAPGSYTVQASANPYQTTVQGAIVLANQITTENFALLPSPGSISGQVTDATTGNPLPGGIVVTVQGNSLTAQSLTDGNGNYSIQGLAPGSYTVRASAINYQTAAQGALIFPNQPTTVNFALQPSPGSISGKLTTVSTGDPVAGALIVVLQDNIQLGTTLTDFNGNYTISGLAPGSYSIQISAVNLQSLLLGATVQANLTTTLNFSLQDQPGTLSGTVIDSLTSQPLAGLEVDILQGGVKVAFALTDSQGNYQIANLATGTYIATVGSANYQTQSIAAFIYANQTTSLNFSLAPQPGSISGQVLDAATNTPLLGVLINAFQGTTLVASVLTDVNGNYILSGFAPGSYSLGASLTNFQTQTRGATVISAQFSTANFSLSAQPGTLTGKVTNSVDNTPVSGATINLLQGTTLFASAITDNNGDYTINGLSPGIYTLAITSNNFQTSTQILTIQANQTTTTNASLNFQAGTISGQVINAQNSNLIAGASVNALQANVLIATSLTDSNGNYLLTGLTPGTYTVVASAIDFQSAALGAIVAPNATTSTNFALQPQPGTIAGLVLDIFSNPISGASIDVLQSNVVIASAISAGNGSYSISGLAPGNYSVRVGATNFQIQLLSVIVLSDLTTLLNFSLPPSPGSISGTVTDSLTSTPLFGATIEALSNNISVASTLTAVDGSYAFTGLAPGNYILQVNAINYQSATHGINVLPNVTTTADFALNSQPGSVIGQLLDASGNPIAGGSVSVMINNILVATALTDGDGNFTINNLAPGSYIIVAGAANFQTSTQGAVIQANLSISLGFNLHPQPGSIIGQVKDLASNPLANVSLSALSNNTVVASVVTDAGGNYSIQGLTPGSYTIRASATNFQTLVQGAIVIASQSTTEDFTLQASPGNIVGQLTDAITGNPLPGGIIVTVQGNALTAESLTDANGNYSIQGLAPGSYTVRASADNYQTNAQGALIVANQSTTVNFALQPSPGTITGQITNFSSGAAIAGASVAVLQANTQIVSAQTDSNGNYTLSGLAPGNYSVQASGTNLQSTLQGATVLANQTTTVDFALQDQPGTVSGQVLDSATGLPLAGVEVDVLQGSVKVAFAISDTQGSYMIANLGTGSYTVTASLANYQTQSIGASIAANQTTSLNFGLVSQPGSISGQVLDFATTAPLAGALINALQGTTLSASILTDANGNYALSGIAPGNYTLTVNLANYQTQTQGTSVLANLTSTVNFSLASQPGTLTGQVLDPSSNPISGATVTITEGSTVIASIFTDSSGNYTLSGLAPGSYILTVTGVDLQTSTQTVKIQANQTTTTNVAISFQAGAISGQVVNDLTSSVIAGATVQASQANVLIASSLTDSNGNYTLTGLAPGTYNLVVGATNFQTTALGAIVASNTTSISNFTLLPQPGSIAGFVKDISSNPISGASVNVLQSNIIIASATTAGDGSYNILGLAPGVYTVRVSETNFQTQLLSVTVQSNATTSLDFSLPPSPGSISGTVTDAVASTPLFGATIEVLSNNISVASTSSAADGSYAFTGLAPGNYILQVNVVNYQSATHGINVLPNLTTTADFALNSQPGSVIGQLLDAIGNPIAGGSVSVMINNILVATTLTDGSGNFTINNLAPGNYIIVAGAANFQTSTQGAVIQANASISLGFNLQSQPGSITGQVKDAASNPLSNVSLSALSNNTVVASVVTDAGGNYSIQGLTPGSYTVRASATNFQTLVQGAIVIANQSTTEDFTLQASPGNIVGQLTDAITGNPLPGGIVVTVQGNALTAESLTDANGNYSIQGLAPGSYTVRASADNYQTSAQGALIVANQSTTVNFALQPSPGTITGQITNFSSGAAIAGASVAVLQANTQIVSAQTDSNGNYTLSGLAPGNYSVQASGTNLQSTLQGATVLANQTTTVDFALQDQPGTVSGQVLDSATGLPLAGVEVDVLQGSVKVAFAITDTQGSYMIANLGTGSYTVTASLANFQTQSIGASIAANQTTSLNFGLVSQPGSISGQVLDFATTAPLAGALINALQGTTLSASILTDANGNYALSGIAPGNYTLTVNLANYQTQTQGTSVLANLTSTVNFSLASQPGTLTGQVLDPSSNPISGATVTITEGSTVIASIFTDSSGNYTLSGLAPGSYILTVTGVDLQTSTQTVKIQANQTTTTNVAISFQAGAISGQVVNDLTSSVIAGATVQASQANVLIASSLTDSNGNYTLTGLAPGTYNLVVGATNFQTTALGAIVAPNTTSISNFTLLPQPGSIAGFVKDISSNPISGASVNVLQSNIIIASATTAGDGSYNITGLAPNVYTIRVNATDFQTQLLSVTVQSNATTSLDFSLPPSPGSISGTVTDAVASTPLFGATIEVLSNNISVASTSSAADGSYAFTGLAPGNYILQVNVVNYQSATHGINVLPNLTTTADFALNSQPGSVIGQLLDAIGNPIAGGSVSVMINNILVATTLTDGSGNFTINNLAPGNYIIVAGAANFQTSTQGAVIQANASISLGFNLQSQPGSITGQVKDAASNPLSNVSLSALSNNTVVASVVTDAGGNYSIQGLTPGSYTVRASATNFQTLVQGAIVIANQSTTEDFTLQASPGNIVGQLTDAITGNPLPGGIIVTVQGNALTAESLTDANGNYSIQGLAPGSYTVRASADNYQTNAQGALIVANQSTTVNFALQPSPVTITGQITNFSSGAAIAGASVAVLQANTQIVSAQTDSNGNYTLSGLAPGNYSVQASGTNLQSTLQGATVLANQTTTVDFALQDQPGTVSGQVLDSATGLPLAGVEVDVLQGSVKVAFAITDTQGSYMIANLGTGSYTVTASLANFQTQSIGASIAANQTTSLNFGLVSQPGSISGQVLDFATTAPLAGALINALQGTTLSASILTDANGNYALSGIAPGNYTLTVNLANYQTQTQGTSVLANLTSTVNFSLASQPGTLTGQVLDPSSNPISGATVTITEGSTVIASVFTDSSGNYTLSGLAPGSYTLIITGNNLQTTTQTVTIQANQTTTTNASISFQAGVISGQILNSFDSSAIAGATVNAFQANILIASILTDLNGNFTLSGLAPGTYNLVASATEFQTAALGATVASNATTSINFSLQPQPGSIVGFVKDILSNPISGSSVNVLQSNIIITSATTANDGSYNISGLAPGVYTIRVSETNFQTQLLSATVLPNATTILNFNLGASPGSINGTVTDAATTFPIFGTIIEVFSNNISIASVSTGTDGSFALTGLAPGNYNLQVNAANYQSATQGVVVQSNTINTANFALYSQSGSVIGQLLEIGRAHV